MSVDQILPLVVATEGGVADIIHLFSGNIGSAIYWLSACTIIVGVILIPRLG